MTGTGWGYTCREQTVLPAEVVSMMPSRQRKGDVTVQLLITDSQQATYHLPERRPMLI